MAANGRQSRPLEVEMRCFIMKADKGISDDLRPVHGINFMPFLGFEGPQRPPIVPINSQWRI